MKKNESKIENGDKNKNNIRNLYKGIDIKDKKFPAFFNKEIKENILNMFYYLKPLSLNIMLLLYNIKTPIYKLRLLYKATGTTPAYTTNVLHDLEKLNFVNITKNANKRNTHIMITLNGIKYMKKWLNEIKNENQKIVTKNDNGEINEKN